MENSDISLSPLSPSTRPPQSQYTPPIYGGQKLFSKSNATITTIHSTSSSGSDPDSLGQLPLQSCPHRTIWERLGPYSRVILSVVLCLIFIPMVAISLLWFRPDLSISSKIVEKGWAPIVTTIATGVLRIGILLLSGICTGIIASLVFQDRYGRGVPLGRAAGLSIHRFSKSDPMFLIPELYSTFKITNPDTIRLVGYLFITLILALFTLCFQFSATALLSDMQLIYVLDIQSEEIALWSPEVDEKFSKAYHIWHTQFPNPIPFGQYQLENGEDVNDSWDTGETLRGFIPSTFAQSHERIKGIHGSLPVLDARYSCIRPVNFNAVIGRLQSSNDGDSDLFYLGGISNVQENSVPHSWGASIKTTFNCTFSPQGNVENKEDIPVVICETDVTKKQGDDLLKGYMVITVGGTALEWERYYKSMLPNPNSTIPITVPFRPKKGWLELSNFEGGNLRLAATLCYTKHSLQLVADSKMTAEFHPHQPYESVEWTPQLTWDLNRGRYDTSQLRRMLTLGSSSSNLITLNKPPHAIPTTGRFEWISKALKLGGNSSIIFCLSCSFSSSGHTVKAHDVTTTIVQDTIQATGNPAVMLQSLFTILFQGLYYQPSYSTSEILDVARFVPRQSPKGRKGFSIVAVFLIIYLILSGGLLVAFCLYNNVTLLGNAWSAVGQLASRPETEDFIKLASRMTDAEVGGHLATQGRKYQLIKLEDGSLEKTYGSIPGTNFQRVLQRQNPTQQETLSLANLLGIGSRGNVP